MRGRKSVHSETRADSQQRLEEDGRVNTFGQRADIIPWPWLPRKLKTSSFIFHALLPTVTVLILKEGQRVEGGRGDMVAPKQLL